jgi:hypothetical protein
LAFIFKTIHRLDNGDAFIEKPNAEFVSAQSIIDAPIGVDTQRTAIEDMLDWLDNNDNVRFISPSIDVCLPLVFRVY